MQTSILSSTVRNEVSGRRFADLGTPHQITPSRKRSGLGLLAWFGCVAILVALSVWLAFAPPAQAAVGDFVIQGRGWGHGTGMSQYGAYQGAKLGASYSQILAFYYQGATLATLTNPSQEMTVRLTYNPTSGPPSNPEVFYQVVLTAVDTSATFSSSYGSGTVAAGTSETLVWSGGKVYVPGWAQPLDFVQMSPTTSAGRVRIQITVTNGAAAQAPREYWGRIRLDPDSTGLEIRNTLLMDKYVGDIKEVPGTWPVEAVKAQAVAARSYALAHTSGLYDDTRSQCYRGYIFNGALSETTGHSSAATATSGKYLTYGGKVVTAFYSSDSGGYTCNDPWGSVLSAPFVAKADPWTTAAKSAYSSWSYTISQQSMNSAMSGLGIGAIVSLSVASRDTADSNSHARTIKVVGTTGTKTITSATLRTYLGSSNLKSTLITSMSKVGTGITRYEQNDSRIAYTGAWTTWNTASTSGGSCKYSNLLPAAVDVKFTGTYLSWVGIKGPLYGKANVSVDGGTAQVVDLYAATSVYKSSVWNTGTLASGTHTVRIEWIGAKNALATNTYIGMDAFDVAGTLIQATATPTGPAPTRYEQSDSHIAYTGTWTTWNTGYVSGSSCKYSNLSSAAVDVQFTGTYLSWVGIKGPRYGKARVTVDGGTAEVVDLYSAASVFKSGVWNTGILVSGTHTVRIEWTGNKNASAINTYIGIDAFDVVGTLG